MGTIHEDKPAHALAPISDPWFVTAVVTLLVNDHVLKQTSPGFVTGKLSDIAGLVVLPVLLGVVLKAAKVRSANAIACVTVGVWFAAMKTIPAIAARTEQLFEAITGSASSIVVDPTDLVGLAGLVIAARVLANPNPILTGRTVRAGLFVAAAFACAATSYEGGTVQDLGVSEDGNLVTNGVQFEGQTPDAPDAEGQAAGLGQYATEACLDENDGGTCFRIVGGKVQSLQGGGSWKTEWSISSAPQIGASVGSGGGYDPTLQATDIVTTPRGEVHVAFDGISPITRSAAGEWTPPFSQYRPIQMSLILLLCGFGGVALTRSVRAHGIASALAVGGAIVALLGSISGIGALVGGALAVGALAVGLQSLTSHGSRLAVPPQISLLGLVAGSLGLAAWKYVVATPYLVAIASLLVGGAIVVLGMFLSDEPLYPVQDNGANDPMKKPDPQAANFKAEINKLNEDPKRSGPIAWSINQPTADEIEAAADRAKQTTAEAEAPVIDDPPMPSAQERAKIRSQLRRKDPNS